MCPNYCYVYAVGTWNLETSALLSYSRYKIIWLLLIQLLLCPCVRLMLTTWILKWYWMENLVQYKNCIDCNTAIMVVVVREHNNDNDVVRLEPAGCLLASTTQLSKTEIQPKYKYNPTTLQVSKVGLTNYVYLSSKPSPELCQSRSSHLRTYETLCLLALSWQQNRQIAFQWVCSLSKNLLKWIFLTYNSSDQSKLP